MAGETSLIVGEFIRSVDDRFRVSLPPEFAEVIAPHGDSVCVLAKERYGSLSLWSRIAWQERIEPGLAVVRQKVTGRWLPTQVSEVQQFHRLLSTRSREVTLAGRSRLVVPEEFRDFLRVKPGENCVIVGAGICVEIWHPETWQEYLKQEIATFGTLFEKLST
jgi:MraZ protein